MINYYILLLLTIINCSYYNWERWSLRPAESSTDITTGGTELRQAPVMIHCSTHWGRALPQPQPLPSAPCDGILRQTLRDGWDMRKTLSPRKTSWTNKKKNIDKYGIKHRNTPQILKPKWRTFPLTNNFEGAASWQLVRTSLWSGHENIGHDC